VKTQVATSFVVLLTGAPIRRASRGDESAFFSPRSRRRHRGRTRI